MENEFKIYTKTGDDGTSGLIGGTRVEKFDERLEAYGTIDELNSWIGLLSALETESFSSKILTMVQNKLFVIGSHLATDESKSDLKDHLDCNSSDIEMLEKAIDTMQLELPTLTHFVLPGGDETVAKIHIARTVCRRAERLATSLSRKVNVNQNILKFLNRLSDYLFVYSRYSGHSRGIAEIFWIPKKM